MTLLSFNVRSLLDHKRRAALANCLLPLDYDILCLTETWLNENVSSFSIFLNNFEIYRRDRTSTQSTGSTKHGGVLFAIRKNINHEIVSLDVEAQDYIVMKISSHDSVLLCCLYNPPATSAYHWTKANISTLLLELKQKEILLYCSTTIITGDLNMKSTNWETMSSRDTNEDSLLTDLLDSGFHEFLHHGEEKQLDVLLTDNPDIINKANSDMSVFKKYSIDEKPCSDHLPYRTLLKLTQERWQSHTNLKAYGLRKADWGVVVEAIRNHPFNPYCYSNTNVLLELWYSWIRKIMEDTLPKVTKHRSELPPWVTSPTSHKMKKLETLKRKRKTGVPNVKLKLKIKRLSKEIHNDVEADLTQFEEDVFRSREFSKIQKYLACVRKKPVIPSIVKRQGIPAIDKKQSADFFNEFFCSVFHKDTPNIVKPYYPNREVNTVHISEERVTKRLGTLQVGMATGPDRIGNLFLQNTATALAKSLALLYRTRWSIKESFRLLGKSVKSAPSTKMGKRTLLSTIDLSACCVVCPRSLNV